MEVSICRVDGSRMSQRHGMVLSPIRGKLAGGLSLPPRTTRVVSVARASRYCNTREGEGREGEGRGE